MRLVSDRFSRGMLFADLEQAVVGITVDLNQLQRIFDLAYGAHEGQVREPPQDQETTPLPYITHPVGVAKLAAQFFNESKLDDNLQDVLEAALLHDVIEDTPIDHSGLRAVTSNRVVDLVLAVTKPSVSGGLTRTQRDEKFLVQIRQAGRTAVFIKLVDSMHNLSRPKSMPHFLLKKTVSKAKQNYAPFLDDFEFPSDLNGAYQDTLQKAHAVISSGAEAPQ